MGKNAKYDQLKKEIKSGGLQRFSAVLPHIKDNLKSYSTQGNYIAIIKSGTLFTYDTSGKQVYKLDGGSLNDFRNWASSKTNKPNQTKSQQDNVEKAREKAEKAYEEQKGLTEDQKKEAKEELDLLTKLATESELRGIPIKDLLIDLYSDDKIDARMYQKLKRLSEGDRFTDRSNEIIDKHQENRESILDRLENESQQPKNREQAELEALIDPETGSKAYVSLAEALSEEQKENMTIPAYDRLNYRKRNEDYQGKLAPITQQIDDLVANRKPAPSRDDAKSAWERDFGPTAHLAGSHYDNKISEAAAGSSGRSSGVRMLEEQKAAFLNDQALQQQRGIYQDLMTEYNANNVGALDFLDRSADGYHKTILDPLEKQDRFIRENQESEDRRHHAGLNFSKDLAEGRLQNDVLASNEQMKLNEMQNSAANQNYDYNSQLANNIYQFGMLAQQLNIDQQGSNANFQKMSEDLWARRTEIKMQLERMGMIKEAEQLQRASQSKSEWIQIMKNIAPMLGTAIGGAAGGPAGAMVLGTVGSAIAGTPAPSRDFTNQIVQFMGGSGRNNG